MESEQPRNESDEPLPSELEASARATIRRILLHITGTEPTPKQIEQVLRSELTNVNALHGEDAPQRVLRQMAALGTSPACEGQADRSGDPGLPDTWITTEQLHEAEAAFSLARRYGVGSLIEALQWYVKHRHRALVAPKLEQCVAEFLVTKRCEGVRAPSLRTYRSQLAKLVAQFGGEQPLAVTPKRFLEFFASLPSGSTRVALWRAASTFFRWTVRQRYAFDNPVELAVRRPCAGEGAQRFIFTPAETASVLRRAKHTPEIGFWVLALFSGLRVNEIRGLGAQDDPWACFNLDAGLISLPKSLAKTRGRQIRISPVLRQWLKWVQFTHSPLHPPNRPAKCQWIRTLLVRTRGRIAKELDLPEGRRDERFYNIARRTYLSYRLALPGASYAEVSGEAGNSESVLRKYYRLQVSRRDALRYFRLFPGRL